MANLTSSRSDDLFDPSFENKPGDYTKASQGFRGDGSTGTLLSGLGDFIKDKFTADDAYLKQKTREEYTVEADRIRNMFSGLDQRQGGWTLKAVGVENPDLIMKEIEKRGERLKVLDQAYASGKITDTHRWMLLDVAARELRSKYPGYREHIDNVVKDVTGADPANKVIDGIRQDAMRGGADDEDKMLKQMVKKAQEDGYMQYTGTRSNADGLPVDAKGQRLSLGDFQNAVGKVRAVHYATQAEKEQLARDDAAGKADDKMVFRNAQARIDQTLDGVFKGASSTLGNNPEEVSKRLEQIQNDVAAGKPLAGQELVAMQAQWQATRSQVMKQVQLEIASTPGLKNLNSEQRKNLLENAELRLAQFDDILINKNFGLLNHNKALSDQIGNADVARLIDNNQMMRHVNALNKMGGADLVKNYFSVNPQSFNDLQKLLKNQAITEMLATGKPIHELVQQAAKEAKVTNPQYYDTLIDTGIKTILDPKTPKQILDNAINSLYGPQNANLLFRHENGTYVPTFPASKNQEYYAKLTSPEVMKRVLELSRTSGDSSYWANYYGWATRSYTNNSEVHRALQDVKRLSTETDQPFGVRFDPTTSSLSLVQRPVINTKRDSGGIMYPQYRARLTEATETFNRLTQPMIGIMKETKQDINSVMLNGIFSLNGMDPNDLSYKPVK